MRQNFCVLLLSVIILTSCNKKSNDPTPTNNSTNSSGNTSSTLVTTYAGSGIAGSTDGVKSVASFNQPAGIVTDRSGNLYVIDGHASYVNNIIRKISFTGVVTTFAGSGSSSSVDGVGTAASFNALYGIAIDGGGNLYVADNGFIRKITSAGVVTTLTTSTTFSSVIASTFPSGGPYGGTRGTGNFFSVIGVDNNGNIYVSDMPNGLIWKVTSAGTATILAGGAACPATPMSGTGLSASLGFIRGGVLDASGNVYVADDYYNIIWKINSGGVASMFVGSGSSGSTNGTGANSSFSDPIAVAVDSFGNLYVTQDGTTAGNDLIRKVSALGVVSNLAGTGLIGSANGGDTVATFSAQPSGITVDASGNMYVADTGNNLIRKITLN